MDLKLDHPNVYKILDYGRSQMQKEGAPFGNEVSFIVTQLAANGNLTDYYRMANGLGPKYARPLFEDLVKAMTYIHSQGIVHMRMVISKCILDSEMNLKLCGMSSCTYFDGQNKNPFNKMTGFTEFMAPEIF